MREIGLRKSLLFFRPCLMAITLILFGCTQGNVATWKPETDSERELRESREALQRTVGEGALFGAALGATIGAATGGVGGGFQGAQVGQFAGASAGTYVKSIQASYSSKEQQLRAIERDIQKTNANLERNIRAMKASLAELEAQAPVDQTRKDRIAMEANAAVVVGQRYEDLFVNSRKFLRSQGYQVTPLNSDIETLTNRVRAMRDIASDLAKNL